MQRLIRAQNRIRGSNSLHIVIRGSISFGRKPLLHYLLERLNKRVNLAQRRIHVRRDAQTRTGSQSRQPTANLAPRPCIPYLTRHG